MNIHDIINKCRYGIEIETCVCIIDEDGDIIEEDDYDMAIASYYSIMDDISDEIKRKGFSIDVLQDVKLSDYVDLQLSTSDPDDIDYSKWNIVPDGSIRCNRENFSSEFVLERYIIPNSENKQDCIFDPIEIVSPIFNFNEEPKFKTLTNFYSNLIMNKNAIYMVNTSQGLHINISFEGVVLSDHIEKILKYWIYYENAFFSLVSEERRVEPLFSRRMADLIGPNGKPVVEDWKDYFNQEDSIVDNQGNVTKLKYVALNIKQGGNIIECRIVEGSMNLEFMKLWTELLIYFLARVLLSDSDDPSIDSVDNSNQSTEFSGLEVEKLFKFIYNGSDNKPEQAYNQSNEIIDSIDKKAILLKNEYEKFYEEIESLYLLLKENKNTSDFYKEQYENLEKMYSYFLEESKLELENIQHFKQNILPNLFPSISLYKVEEWQEQFDIFTRLKWRKKLKNEIKEVIKKNKKNKK